MKAREVSKKMVEILVGVPCAIIAYGFLAIEVLYYGFCIVLFIGFVWLWGSRILWLIEVLS